MALLFSGVEPFVQFKIEGIMKINSVKLSLIWTSGSRGDVVQRYFLSGALATLLFSGAKLLVRFKVEES